MFLFRDGLSLMIIRLSVISNKYFLFSWAKTLKLSKECKNLQWSKLAVMYGDCKVHKQQVDGYLPFRPVLLALQTPTYNLAKVLNPISNLLTENDYTVKDSFQFAERYVSKALHYLWVV